MVGSFQVPSAVIAKSPLAKPAGMAVYATPVKFFWANPYMLETRSRTLTGVASVRLTFFCHRPWSRVALSCALGYRPCAAETMVRPAGQPSLPPMPRGATPLLRSLLLRVTNWAHVVGTDRPYLAKIALL